MGERNARHRPEHRPCRKLWPLWSRCPDTQATGGRNGGMAGRPYGQSLSWPGHRSDGDGGSAQLHTTNLRVAVEYNAVGKAAGLPAHLCLKANWSELTINNNTDICELEARFYHESANMPALPAARCYYAHWDEIGRAH